MASLISWLWSDEFYYGRKHTWEEVNSTPGVRQWSTLYMVFPIFIGLSLFRVFFERFMAKPFCEALGVQNDRKKKTEDNSVCEKVFKSISRTPSQGKIKEISEELGWDRKQVFRWFRRRRNMLVSSKMTKAIESCWRYCTYSVLVIFGLFVHLPRECMWNAKMCWIGHPFHAYEDDLVWYHILEIALYLTFSVSQFLDVYRKDFWQMLVHHVVTIILMLISFISNTLRFGSLIMLVHDFSDPLLEAAKIFNYAGWQNVCDGMFVFFAVVFGITRLIFYPIILWESSHLGQFSGLDGVAFERGLALLLVLQVLHIFWAYTIGKMAYSFMVVGKVEKDQRSEGESSTAPEEENIQQKVPLKNCANNNKKKRL